MGKGYGLIGGKLGHSYSKLIHEHLYECDYRLIELKLDELERFLYERDFAGLNVTIPFKQAVIPLCEKLTGEAQRIGSVNTLYFDRDGALTGDNTDHYGMTRMLEEFNLRDRQVVVLGATGGTGKTAACVLHDLGARVLTVSRSDPGGYESVYSFPADYLLNATPVGMYPALEGCPVDPVRIARLQGVADVIYNPARTRLLMRAESVGLKRVGGLKMLVYQAAGSAQRFLGAPVEESRVEETLRWLARKTRSIAFVGMPGSGKSTVARAVAEKLGRELIDTDQVIEARFGPIQEIFVRDGEARFREMEAEVVREAALARGAVIATGGGAVLSEESRARLRANAFVVQLERPLSELATRGRPLSSGPAALTKMYEERLPLYRSARDAEVWLRDFPGETADEVIRRFTEEVLA
jgi:shikimate dehydrogenase